MCWAFRGPVLALQLSSQWGLDSAHGGKSSWGKGWIHHARGPGVEAACHLCPPLQTPLLARFWGSLIPVRVGQDAGLDKEAWWTALFA